MLKFLKKNIYKGAILDIIDVQPVYFSDTKVVLKNISNGTTILAKPIPGAYAGMLVKPFAFNVNEETNQEKINK